jgi:hypothetical protein
MTDAGAGPVPDELTVEVPVGDVRLDGTLTIPPDHWFVRHLAGARVAAR